MKNLSKIRAMNSKGEKRVIRTWARACTIVRRWWDIPLQYMMAGSMSLYISLKTVGHKLGEFAPTRTFRGHEPIQKLHCSEIEFSFHGSQLCKTCENSPYQSADSG